jgi:hypothetical protein
MWSQEEIQHLVKASTDFTYFTNNIFSLSSTHFVGGEYVDNTCRFLSKNRKTMMVSARHHSKSFLFYSYFMWKLLFEGSNESIEAHYFSFNDSMAAYHIGKIKQCISLNPYFRDVKDEKSTAESVLKYSWDKTHHITLHPHGILSFARGIHCKYVYCDDILSDPSNALNPAVIYSINDAFKSIIIDMPSVNDGELHVVGTAQTKDDFFFDETLKEDFEIKVLPAIYNDEETGEEKALWPEWMNLEQLKKEERLHGPAIFSKEYMCVPIVSANAFFSKDVLIEKCVDDNLVLKNPFIMNRIPNPTYAGMDLGKKLHPSHLVILEQRDNKLYLIHHKFMDGWNYSNGGIFDPNNPTQLEYVKMCIKNFNILSLYYDDTRGEFQAFDEQGLLPREMVPVVFSNKSKSKMAGAFDKVVFNRQLILPNDDRLLNQICLVNQNLQATETAQGHADAFWSISLALMGAGDIIGMQDDINSPTIRRRIKTGAMGIFDSEDIPRGW